jgi:hypothetical protein
MNHEGLFPLLLGQNPTPENHAKLFLTIGIPSGHRSAYYISKYKSLVHMSPYIGTVLMWNQSSACFIFTWT